MVVCNVDEHRESWLVDLTVRPELHMPHEFARAFEQTLRIGELAPAKNPTLT